MAICIGLKIQRLQPMSKRRFSMVHVYIVNENAYIVNERNTSFKINGIHCFVVLKNVLNVIVP